MLALDYGTKRTGIAVSDESGVFAFPVTTVPTHQLLDWMKEYISKENVTQLIIGQPMHADDSPAALESHISGFIKKVLVAFPLIPIARHDERYTSKMAFEAILAGGVPKKKRQDKSLIDKVSATIILQSYIESQKNHR